MTLVPVIGITDIITALGILTSIFIAVRTLNQNSRMIEESTRPYVVVSLEATHFDDLEFYIQVKNYGKSAAFVHSLKPNQDISNFTVKDAGTLFQSFTDLTLAPNQKIYSTIDRHKFNKLMQPLQFEVSYSSQAKTYKESFTLNADVISEIEFTRTSTNSNELKTISYVLQDLVEKIM